MDNQQANKNNDQELQRKVILFLVIFFCIVAILFAVDNGSKDASSTSDEVRCWYCSKVIIYEGRPIHATNVFNNTYECEYCGKKNVVK